MKILIIGLGSVGKRHATNLKTILGDRVDILAYRVRNLPHGLPFPITEYSDLNEALNAGPNGVLICNPPNLHLDMAFEMAKRGVPFFLEKPISNTYNGVEELVELVRNSLLISFVGYQYRFHPDIKTIKKSLPYLGNICSVRVESGSYLPEYHDNEDYRDMYEANENRGGGVILSQIHDLDLIYYLFGLPQRIYAQGGHLSNLEINGEDVAEILLEYNIQGRLVPISIHQDFIQKEPIRKLTIVGTDSTIEADLLKGIERNDLFMMELDQFIMCLYGQQIPEINIWDGVPSLKMALIAKESMKVRKIIEL